MRSLLSLFSTVRTGAFALCAFFLSAILLLALDCNDLITSGGPLLSFDQLTSGMTKVRDFEFGTNNAGRGGIQIGNMTDLAQYFCPYGIAGTTTIHQEWEAYPGGTTGYCGSFDNSNSNWQFTSSSLQLVANQNGSSLKPCSSNTDTTCAFKSGQIASTDTFAPDAANTITNTGCASQAKINSDSFHFKAYAFEIEFQFPAKTGAWPAFWLYTRAPNYNDASEIDMVEFFVEDSSGFQNQDNPTFDTHGPGVGSPSYNTLNMYNVLQSTTDFSMMHHKYQVYWTTDYRYSYLDGGLVQAIPFTWTSCGPAQVIANLAFGSSEISPPHMEPTSFSEVPAAMDITHIKVWAM